MKDLFCALGFLAIVSFCHLQAQIVWKSSAAITADTDVLNNGTYFDATQLQPRSSSTETVNGVTFGSLNGNDTFGNISISGVGLGSDSFSGSGISASYQAILTQTAYQDYPGTFTVSLANLQLGHNYQVQIWLGANNSRSTSYTSTNTIDLPGADYAIGNIIDASSTTASFVAAGDASVHSYAEIDAISVRDITSIPEPSTWAILLAGVALVGVAARRRLVGFERV